MRTGCGSLHDRLSHPGRAFLNLEATAGTCLPPSETAKSCESVRVVVVVVYDRYLRRCRPWDKNSYDPRVTHGGESTVGATLFVRPALSVGIFMALFEGERRERKTRLIILAVESAGMKPITRKELEKRPAAVIYGEHRA